MPTVADVFFESIDVSPNGCWNWKRGLTGDGYSQIKIGGKQFACHRLMWLMFKGEIPKGLYVLHGCDNRKCINPDHLFLGTNDDNMRDGALKNRFTHKLSIREVLEIRRLWKEGVKQKELAKMFGINQGNVSRIVNKNRRQHV